jgi:putative glutamine amidotransferase
VTAPVVGITMYLETVRWGCWERPAALLAQSYVDSAQRAGGVPVLLPPVPGGASEAAAVAGALDALVLSGGPDVDPVWYGEDARPTTVTRPDRDAWELAVLRAALNRSLPVLAICRGMQLLNVACGGSLHQHLPDVVHHDRHLPTPGVFGPNAVRISPDSRLAAILGAGAVSRCHHHQAVRQLGAGLVATGWADDGTIEALEHSRHDFVLGVQWHPEEDQDDRRLFGALLDAAAGKNASARL